MHKGVILKWEPGAWDPPNKGSTLQTWQILFCDLPKCTLTKDIPVAVDQRFPMELSPLSYPCCPSGPKGLRILASYELKIRPP